MFTQCPECLTIQPLTLAQLRQSRGMLRCGHCSALFDALERISETTDIISPPEPSLAIPLPWDTTAVAHNKFWRTGLLIGLLLLLGQVIYFESYAFSQNPALRPSLAKLCQLVSCRLPDYKNLQGFTVLHGSFTPLPDQNYALSLVFNNQAAFAQPYPNIKLSLQDYNGDTFAYRIFKPREYLSENALSSLMATDATTEINLKIAAPKTKIGGSTFDLVY